MSLLAADATFGPYMVYGSVYTSVRHDQAIESSLRLRSQFSSRYEETATVGFLSRHRKVGGVIEMQSRSEPPRHTEAEPSCRCPKPVVKADHKNAMSNSVESGTMFENAAPARPTDIIRRCCNQQAVDHASIAVIGQHWHEEEHCIEGQVAGFLRSS